MRLAVVVTGGLHPSGREQVVPSWLSLFARLARTHDVHAFVLRHLPRPTTYQLHGFTVHDLGRPSAPLGLSAWAQELALVRAMSGVVGANLPPSRGPLRRTGQGGAPFDLVHGFWGDPAGYLATRVARRFSLSSVVTFDSGEFVGLQDIDYGSQRTARGRARVRESCTTATCVHVCTEFMSREAAKLGVTPTIIPLGVEVDEPEGSSPPGFGLPDGPPYRLLQVGSLSRVKNQALLIDALAIVSRTLDAHLDLVGEDTLGGELQAQAGALGLSDRVVFHGFVPHDQIGAIRARAHLYVQTSRHESAGVAVLEAAAAGLPVMGTPVGYIADWAPDRAVAIRQDSAQALAAAITAILQDSPQRQRLAAAAREFARTHSAGWTAGQLQRLYSDLQESRRSGE